MYVSSPTWQIQKFKIHCSLTARLSHASPRGKCKSVFNNIQIKSQRLSIWSKWDKSLHWSLWQISAAVEQAEKWNLRRVDVWPLGGFWCEKWKTRGRSPAGNSWSGYLTRKKDWHWSNESCSPTLRNFFTALAILQMRIECALILMCCFSSFSEAALQSRWSHVKRWGSLHRQYLVRG